MYWTVVKVLDINQSKGVEIEASRPPDVGGVTKTRAKK